MQKKPIVSFEEAVRKMLSAERPHDRPELKGSPLLILDLIEALEKSATTRNEEATNASASRKASVPDA